MQALSIPQPICQILSTVECRKAQHSIKKIDIAIQIIKAIGCLLSSVCVVGIWALPLDLVIASNAVVVLTIPAALLPLPIVLLVWGVAHLILKAKNEKNAQSYLTILLKHFIRTNSCSENLLKEYQRVALITAKLDISDERDVVISKEKFSQILDAFPHLSELTLNATNLQKDVYNENILKKSCLKKIVIKECQAMSKDDYQLLSGGGNIEQIEFIEAQQINLDLLKEIIGNKYEAKTDRAHHYIFQKKTSRSTSHSDTYIDHDYDVSSDYSYSFNCRF